MKDHKRIREELSKSAQELRDNFEEFVNKKVSDSKPPTYGDHFAESKAELDEQRKKFDEWRDAQGRTYAERERDIKRENEIREGTGETGPQAGS